MAASADLVLGGRAIERLEVELVGLGVWLALRSDGLFAQEQRCKLFAARRRDVVEGASLSASQTGDELREASPGRLILELEHLHGPAEGRGRSPRPMRWNLQRAFTTVHGSRDAHAPRSIPRGERTRRQRQDRRVGDSIGRDRVARKLRAESFDRACRDADDERWLVEGREDPPASSIYCSQSRLPARRGEDDDGPDSRIGRLVTGWSLGKGGSTRIALWSW